LTGNDDEESDLDLLVDPAETTSLSTLAAFKPEAEALLGVPVSALTPDALPLKFRAEGLQKAQPLSGMLFNVGLQGRSRIFGKMRER
jgi:uncharacterized protein